MDSFLPSAAHHEAGHALMSYIVGWSIEYIEFRFDETVLTEAVTKYDVLGQNKSSPFFVKRRLLCLLGGPVAQVIFEKRTKINIDELGPDGVLIDAMLSGMDSIQKERLINDTINAVSIFLRLAASVAARDSIVKELLSAHRLLPEKFIAIVTDHQVARLPSETWGDSAIEHDSNYLQTVIAKLTALIRKLFF